MTCLCPGPLPYVIHVTTKPNHAVVPRCWCQLDQAMRFAEDEYGPLVPVEILGVRR